MEACSLVKFLWCVGEATQAMLNLILRLCDAEQLERKPQNPALSADESSRGNEDSWLAQKASVVGGTEGVLSAGQDAGPVRVLVKLF